MFNLPILQPKVAARRASRPPPSATPPWHPIAAPTTATSTTPSWHSTSPASPPSGAASTVYVRPPKLATRGSVQLVTRGSVRLLRGYTPKSSPKGDGRLLRAPWHSRRHLQRPAYRGPPRAECSVDISAYPASLCPASAYSEA
jgi:hypothetical protein